MSGFFSVSLYAALVGFVTLVMLGLSALFPSQKSAPDKFLPYESGIKTQTHLFQKRFPLQYYVVALIFLVFEVEVIFLFPWAVVGQAIGSFAFYEMAFFLLATLVGFIYVWRKRGLEWD